MSEPMSRLISRVLDDLGYSEDIRQYRVDKYNSNNSIYRLSSHRTLYEPMLVGSKAEGTSKWSESDFDYLLIYPSIKVTECAEIEEVDSELTLLLDTDSSPPGYCKLKLLRPGRDSLFHREFLMHDCYVYGPGCARPLYLSSTSIVHMQSRHLPHYSIKAGPSNKGQYPGDRERDNVFAIRCSNMPSCMKVWYRRHEMLDWPTRLLKEQIADSDVFVVPIGMHDSCSQHTEWRISFNMAEKKLIQSFTTVQYKVYVLMKLFIKEVIQPQCPESVTSYIVKTLMLWIVESLPAELWRNVTLVDLFLHVTHILHQSVQRGFCPVYFIPECNVLHGRVTLETRQTVADLLSTLMSDGYKCVLNITSVRTHILQCMFAPQGVMVRVCRNVGDEEKILIMDNVRLVHAKSQDITIRSNLLTCVQGDASVPYEGLLTDIVSEPTTETIERRVFHIAYIFSQILSQFALQQCVNATSSNGANTRIYIAIRRYLKILYGNSNKNVLCGRIRLALLFYMFGQYTAMLNVLTTGASKMRSYMPKLSFRITVHRPGHRQWLHTGISTKQMTKILSIHDIHFDHQMEPCLPKALRFEVYRSWTGQDFSWACLFTDPEILLYYLQYLCYAKLGQWRNSDVAFANLVWCATSRDSSVEYKEVALNVLGHCFIEKGLLNRAFDALVASVMMLKHYPHRKDMKTNAAIWHMAILLNKYQMLRA